MKNKRGLGINIGTSSILLIFVILCLVAFASLSLSSAMADNKLSEKAKAKTIAYYDATNLAEQRLAEIDEQLAVLYEYTSSEDEYYEGYGRNIGFTVSISDTQTIEVTLEVLYPENEGDPFYKIISYKEVTSIPEEEYDDTVTVIP